MLRWSLVILCLSVFSVTVVSIPVHRVTRGSVRAANTGAAWPPRNPAKFAIRRANPGAPITARQREIYKKVQSPALPSSKYREKAERSPYHVTRGPNNQWSVARQPKGTRRHGRANEAGDHVFELQMLHKGLQQNGKTFNSLDRTHRRAIRRIMNHPSNMQFVDAGVNSGKGQWIKGAMNGSPIRPSAKRDGYIKATMPIAHHTANKLDAYLTHHNLATAGTMSNLLHRTYRTGGALGHNEAIGALPTRPPGASRTPSPASSEPTTSGSEASSSGRSSPARSSSWETDSNASTRPGSRASSPPPSQTPSQATVASTSQPPAPVPAVAAANAPTTANAPPIALPRRNARRTTRDD